MTEYIVVRPLVRDRFYEVGDRLTLSDDDATGLLAVEPGIIINAASAAEVLAGLTNQLVPWVDFSLALPLISERPIKHTNDGWMPPLRGGDHPDLQTLMFVADMLRDEGEYVLELGTAYGNSACNMLYTAGRKIACLDTVCALPEQISGEIITKAFEQGEIGRQLHRAGYLAEGDARIIYQNTLNLVPTDLRDEYGLCVIDACHDVDYVLNDLAVCTSVLAKDGVIMLHDVYPGSGPYQALQLHNAEASGLIIRTLGGTWWAIAAWQEGWERLEAYIGSVL
jgi:predicted O-methyltransferase YrrM